MFDAIILIIAFALPLWAAFHDITHRVTPNNCHNGNNPLDHQHVYNSRRDYLASIRNQFSKLH